MLENRATHSYVAKGFLLQELLVFMALSLSFTIMITLLVTREKRALRALQRSEQRGLYEVLILQLVIADIARAQGVTVDEDGVLSCCFFEEGLPQTVSWLSQQGGLKRRIYKNGKFSQTHCYGDVLRGLKAALIVNKLVSLAYEGGGLIEVAVGNKQ